MNEPLLPRATLAPVPSTPSPDQVLKKSRERAAELLRRAGGSRTRSLLETAAADLTKRIRSSKQLQTGGGDPFTLSQMKATLAQVEAVLKPLQVGLQGVVVGDGRAAAEQAATDAVTYLRAAEARYSGIAQPLALREASLLDASVEGANASILRRIASDPDHPRRPGVLARYGANVIDDFEAVLRNRFVAKKPWDEVRDELTEKSPFLQGKPAFWAERIVRTEVMAAHNRAGWEVLRRAGDELGDVVKILSCIDDVRTGSDSLAVHGQIRRPEEAFESWNGLFQHPPDRPNDRGVVVAHRLSWPIPDELKPRPWSEVEARWKEEGRKGAPPPRPEMSTVDRKQFGKEPEEDEPKRPEDEPPEEAEARIVKDGIRDEDLDFIRDPGSYREESRADVARAYDDGAEEGKDPTEVALSMDPIEIDLYPGSRPGLRDGRHRLREARERGAKAIRATLTRYDEEGEQLSERTEKLKLRGPGRR